MSDERPAVVVSLSSVVVYPWLWQSAQLPIDLPRYVDLIQAVIDYQREANEPRRVCETIKN